MKEKRDCKECGKPLKDWQINQGYELCQECYSSDRRKTSNTTEEAKEEPNEEDLNEDDQRLEG